MSREAREAAREKQRERLRGGEAVEQPEEDTSRRKHKVGVERGWRRRPGRRPRG